MSPPGTLAPGPLDGAALSRWWGTIGSFPCLRIPCLSRLAVCPWKMMFWLRFRELRSWGCLGVQQRWEWKGHRTHAKTCRVGGGWAQRGLHPNRSRRGRTEPVLRPWSLCPQQGSPTVSSQWHACESASEDGGVQAEGSVRSGGKHPGLWRVSRSKSVGSKQTRVWNPDRLLCLVTWGEWANE